MINKKQIQEYEEKGFFVLKKFLSKIEIKNCSKSLEDYAKRFKSKNNRNINYTKNNTVNSIHDLEKWIWTTQQNTHTNDIDTNNRIIFVMIKYRVDLNLIS